MSIFKDYKVPVGLSLCMLGVSLGNFLRVLTNINLVIPFMVISFLCLVNVHNVVRLRFPNMSKSIFLLLLSQIIIVLYMWIGNDVNLSVAKDVFIYYSVLLIIGISSLPKVHSDKIVRVFYVMSTINALLAAYLFFNGLGGMMSGEVDKDYLNSLEETGKAMIFLYPSAGVYHTMATLSLLKDTKFSNKLLKFCIVGLLFLDFILIISSGKRTVVLIFALYILYYLWNERKFSSLRNFIKFIPVIVVVFIVIKFMLPSVPFVTEFVDQFVDRLTKGIDTLFGLDNSNFDESAGVRVEIRKKALDIFNKDFGILNYIFGKGYMIMYMDQPLLQCFFDMGIIGIFVYVYNVLYVSLKHLKKKTSDPNYFMFKLGCINIVLTCLTAGTPYGYLMYCPVLFMLYAANTRPKDVR